MALLCDSGLMPSQHLVQINSDSLIAASNFSANDVPKYSGQAQSLSPLEPLLF